MHDFDISIEQEMQTPFKKNDLVVYNIEIN